MSKASHRKQNFIRWLASINIFSAFELPIPVAWLEVLI